MLAAYEDYARNVGVLDMPEGYSAQGTVAKKSYTKMLISWAPYLIALIVAVLGLVLWMKRRFKK
jgi:hypothetical protein